MLSDHRKDIIDFEFATPPNPHEMLSRLRLAEQYINRANQRFAYDELRRDSPDSLYRECLTICVKMFNIGLINELFGHSLAPSCYLVVGNTCLSRLFQFNQSIPLNMDQIPRLLRAACLVDASTGRIVTDSLRAMFKWKQIWNCLKNDQQHDVPCNDLFKYYLITGQSEFFNLYYMAAWADIYCGGRRVHEIAHQSKVILAPFRRFAAD